MWTKSASASPKRRTPMLTPLLLIDAGNTRLKWAEVRGRGTIALRGEITTQDVTASFLKKLARSFQKHHVVLACVVPKLVPAFKNAFAQRLHVVTGTSPSLRMTFRYPKPAEVGADRLAAAVAAHADGFWPAIVISCGTASAFTVINGKGQFCGGVIAPGLQAQLNALLGATAQLPRTALHAPRHLPAISTEDAIRAGVLLSFQGGVREITTRLFESLPPNPSPRILLTGGDAHHLRAVFGPGAKVRPLLVMEGLRIIGTRIFISS
jgi:type III pantothenate kinase